jgi:cation diffusion facilitator CzcD-associated flavoprotein CzcO
MRRMRGLGGLGGRIDTQVWYILCHFGFEANNSYIGCACDIPSHSYQYSFDPNPNWSAFYAPAEEICAYLQGMADKYGVMRYVKLSHKITSCRWDDSAKRWYGHFEE